MKKKELSVRKKGKTFKNNVIQITNSFLMRYRPKWGRIKIQIERDYSMVHFNFNDIMIILVKKKN